MLCKKPEPGRISLHGVQVLNKVCVSLSLLRMYSRGVNGMAAEDV